MLSTILIQIFSFAVVCCAVQAIVYQVVEQRGSPHGWNWVFHISDLFRWVDI
jgi:hypothetical protein